MTVSLRASFGCQNYIYTNNHGSLRVVIILNRSHVCFILLDNKAKIATLEEEMSDQKKKWTQQEGNLFFGIQVQAKC